MTDHFHDNRRASLRTPSNAVLEISHDAFGTLILNANNVSAGGFFVKKGEQPLPPEGTVVEVIIRRYTGALNERPVRMQVVHKNREGMGLAFL